MIREIFKRIMRKAGQKPLPDSTLFGNDEFFRWLSFAVPGMTGGGNVENMGYAVKNLPSDSPIVEIGSFCGLSTIIISRFKTKFKKTNPLFTCDKWEFEGSRAGETIGEDSGINHNTYRNFVMESYKRNVSTFCGKNLPFTIEALSDDFFKMWDNRDSIADVFGRTARLGGPVSFAFIDGNHTYEFARRDFENVHKNLEKGGFVLFDDSSDYSKWEVNRLAREIQKSDDYELVAKNPNYMFRKI